VIIDGDGNTVVIGDSGSVDVDPELIIGREAEQNAREAAFYEQVWEERAAADPLGRGADELRLAWESREPIPIEEVPAGESSLGYAATPTFQTMDAVSFGVLPTPTQLIGATR
jgi:hypothetical protein